MVDAYIELIQKRNTKISKTFIFNTFFHLKYSNSKKLNDYSYEKISKFWEKKKIKLNNYENILIPINIKANHWSLVNVSIQNRKITYFDSLENNTEGFKVMREISELFTEYIKKNKQDDNLITINLMNNTTKSSDDEAKSSNKSKFSFLSNLNHINENLIAEKPLHSENETDSENDLQIMSSFWNFQIFDTPKQNNLTDCGVFMCKFIDYISAGKPFDFSQEDIDYLRYQIGIEIMEGKLLDY